GLVHGPEPIHKCLMALLTSEILGGCALVVREPRIGARTKKHLGHLAIAVQRGGMKRDVACLLPLIRIGAAIEKQLHHLAVSGGRSGVNRRDLLRIARGSVHGGTALDEFARDVAIAEEDREPGSRKAVIAEA